MQVALSYNRKDASERIGVSVKEFDLLCNKYPEKLTGFYLRPDAKNPRWSERQLNEFIDWCVKFQVHNAG